MKYIFPESEPLVKSGLANHFVDGVAIGGRLYLSTQRLLFVPNKMNVVVNGIDYRLTIFIEDIKYLDSFKMFKIFSTGLSVHLTDGQHESFVLNGRKKWEAKIAEIVQAWRPPSYKSFDITFDEAYCHTAGKDEKSRVYEIPKGSNEIIFSFGSFDKFWKLYSENPHAGNLPQALALMEEGKAELAVSVIDGELAENEEDSSVISYGYSPIEKADKVALNVRTLNLPDNDGRLLNEFTEGSIVFGIMEHETGVFNVLWGTMYKSV